MWHVAFISDPLDTYRKGGSQQRILRLAKEYAGGTSEIGILIETTPARS